MTIQVVFACNEVVRPDPRRGRVMTDDPWDEEEDWQLPDYGDESDATEMLPCPHCGAPVYEESQRCPACGDYIVFDSSPLSGRPAWWIILGVLGVTAVIAALVLM